MTRASRPQRTPGRLAASALCAVLLAPAAVDAAETRYRVEVLVFRNLNVPAEPDEVNRVRRFHDAFELEDAPIPEAPVLLDKQDGTFATLRTRLQRLADYEPLAKLTWEQTLFDYHPPVRVHDEQVMGDEMVFPGGVAYLDLAALGQGDGWFDDYVEPLYRLDGTIQLRRSRFLHVDLDLEYRLEGPAWARDFTADVPGRLEPGFEWVGTPPSGGAAQPTGPRGADPGAGSARIEVPNAPAPVAVVDPDSTVPPEPYQLHRLRQSRQVKTDTLQYFDSAYLGAIVRVTTIADDGS